MQQEVPNEQDEVVPEEETQVNIYIEGPAGQKYPFRPMMSDTFESTFVEFTDYMAIDVGWFFFYKGERIYELETPKYWGMEDGAVVKAFINGGADGWWKKKRRKGRKRK